MIAREVPTELPIQAPLKAPAVADLTEEERRQMLVEWNETAAEYPRERCIHQLFEEQVLRTPEAIAIEFEGNSLTYAQLDDQANRLAHLLRKHGVGPEVRVGLCAHRSLQMMVGVLGILKAGGAYVPIDLSYPAERVEFMLGDARVALVLTHGEVGALLGASGVPTLPLEQVPPTPCQQPLPSDVVPGCGAYVLYTSGSTGRPKGVLLSHEALVNLLWWQMRVIPQPGRTLQFASIGFDASFHEIFLAWCSGGTLVLVSEQTRRDPKALLDFIAAQGIQTLNLSVAVLQQLGVVVAGGGELGGCVRVVFATAEQLQITEEVRGMFSGPNAAALYNHYGPTEAHVVTAHKLEGDARTWAFLPSIGVPISNVAIHVLDGGMQPVGVGVSGEIYIGGVCLARGYLGRGDLTAEKFVPDPISGVSGGRLYRTGDLGRYHSDGKLEYLGRMDHQVKIRGFRIELGEIESVLVEHPGVREAVVLAREDVPGDKRLVGYLVTPAAESLGDLRSFLGARLPEYMVPGAFVRLDALPLTPNGKVDRRALPAPEGGRFAMTSALVEPRTPTEKWLVKTWQTQLGIGSIGIRDSFFEMGGHSLMAVRIFDLIQKERGRSLSPATLFQAPTIEALAAILDQEDWKPDWKCLVAIRPNGTRPPFFFMHGALANVLFCEILARNLPHEIPLFGVQSLGLDGKAEPLTRVEDMAELYLREIQSVQPEGPYYLGGLSFGGLIALEMAQQLHAQGQEVGMLAMLNSDCPVCSPHFPTRSWLFERKVIPWMLRAERHLLNLRKQGLKQFLRRKAAGAWKSPNRLATNRARNSHPTSPPDALGRIFHLNHAAERAYRPRHYPGRITFFYAAERHPLQDAVTDTRLAWSDFAEGGFELHLVPGHHATMRREPHVRVLTDKLATCLVRAQDNDARASSATDERPKDV
jgi:amino acid adenylation domain-containing protein